MSPYDYDKVFNYIQSKGRQDFGKSFSILEEDKPTITKLAAYFLKDTYTCNQEKILLHKGILLSGPVGCGKTSLMHLMKYFSNHQQAIYILKPCREVSFEFIKDGYEVMNRYGRNSFAKSGQTEIPRHYCFDDLGTENNLKYFGNECNVMAEVLLTRYDLFISRKLITHITTNLAAGEIEKMYGNRVRSRMRELCNLIAFPSVAIDKRK
jgi:DNA replication protein DnaC